MLTWQVAPNSVCETIDPAQAVPHGTDTVQSAAYPHSAAVGEQICRSSCGSNMLSP